jgi:bifunctional non-homologous end joining protein LigD
MKHSKVWAPAPRRRVRIREKTKIGEYLIADTLSALVGLVQMGVVEVHTWNARFTDLERPDRIVIDLDPGDGGDHRGATRSASCSTRSSSKALSRPRAGADST